MQQGKQRRRGSARRAPLCVIRSAWFRDRGPEIGRSPAWHVELEPEQPEKERLGTRWFACVTRVRYEADGAPRVRGALRPAGRRGSVSRSTARRRAARLARPRCDSMRAVVVCGGIGEGLSLSVECPRWSCERTVLAVRVAVRPTTNQQLRYIVTHA